MIMLRRSQSVIAGEGGFTFTELLVALTILGLVAVPLLSLLQDSCCYTAAAGRRTAALNLCRERLEELKSAGSSCCLALFEGGREECRLLEEADSLPEGCAHYRRETVLEKRAFLLEPAGAAGYLRITVTVYYNGRGGESAVALATNLGER